MGRSLAVAATIKDDLGFFVYYILFYFLIYIEVFRLFNNICYLGFFGSYFMLF